MSEEPIQARIEYSLMLIKPNLFRNGGTDRIRTAVVQSGAEIIKEKEIQLTKTQILTLYRETKGYLSEILEYMASGPSYIFLVRESGAIDKMCKLRGTTELGGRKSSGLRHLYALNPLANSIHAPSSYQEAKQDMLVLLKDELYDLLNFSTLGRELATFLNYDT